MKLRTGRGVGHIKAFSGDALRDRRVAKGVSAARLSKYMATLGISDVSTSTIYSWEYGACKPSKDTVRVLALCLGCRVRDLTN